MKNPRFIDLCAGIGGFRLAFEKVNCECVLTCEIDKYAQLTYQANFKDNIFETDIRKIDENTMPDFDILCAGFPCQAFSLAGKRQGFNDIRGTIFFDIARILDAKRPKSFLLENVKNLKSHDKGNTFKTICNSLDSLNYWHETISINAQYFVPQKRERVYIVGLDKNKYSKEQFNKLVDKIKADYIEMQSQQLNFWSLLEKNVNQSYTLSDKLWLFLQAHAKKHSEKGNGFGFGLMKPQDVIARTLTARYYKDGSEILIEQKGNNPRRLTERECARIMGFPDSFQIVCSKTQSYKQFGNSVVVPVIEMLARNIQQSL